MAEVEGFDICQCFPQDIIHVLLEGVIPYETKLLLRVLIDEKRLFTINDFSQRLASFDYGYMESKNKPSPLTRESVNGCDAKLKQSGKCAIYVLYIYIYTYMFVVNNFLVIFLFLAASQMCCLFRFIPIILGDLVDNDSKQWHCFLKLWNIVQMCTAPVISKDDVSFLKMLIEEHHILFKEAYPIANIIPKLHYMVHIPDDMIR